MGNHRAPRKLTSRRRWITVMLALTGAFVVVVVLIKIAAGREPTAGGLSSSRDAPAATSSTRPPSPSTRTSPSGTGSPSASATPAVSPTDASPKPTPTPAATRRPGSDLPDLLPAPARRLLIGGLAGTGFDAAVSPVGGRLSPRSQDEVARWGARGLPGNPGTDTVVVVGSTRPSAALARLAGVRTGAKISLNTDAGTVSYTVTSVGTVASAGATRDPALRAEVPGRLVLLGARYDATGKRASRDLLVVATISAVRRG